MADGGGACGDQLSTTQKCSLAAYSEVEADLISHQQSATFEHAVQTVHRTMDRGSAIPTDAVGVEDEWRNGHSH